MRAERAVEPTRSENITVTWRRSALSLGDAPTAAMSIRPLWHWPSRSFRQPAMACRTIVSSGDSLFVSVAASDRDPYCCALYAGFAATPDDV
jgi:hypothetical protein